MTRSTSRTLKGAGLTLAVALLAGCQSSDTATMNVRLVDGPALEYSELNVHVLRVQISKEGEGWITLGEPDVIVNLLSLTGGMAETLVEGATIPAGTYGQMRLVLARDGNTIVTPDGEHPLKVPSGIQSGVKLNVHFDVQPNTTKDVFIDFDAHRSVFVHRTGASEQYILRPVVRAFDRVVTGAVTGFLTDAATGAPLPGAEVMAETLDAGGQPAIARSTTTAPDGSYVLDLLPIGGAYWVAAQPRVGTVAYGAGAAGPFDVTEAAPVAEADLAFPKADATGGVAGTIVPVASGDAFDEVFALGQVTVGATPRTFVLRTTSGVVATGGTESYAIDLLPVATYTLFVTRATPDGTGGFAYASGTPATANVTQNATATVPLAGP